MEEVNTNPVTMLEFKKERDLIEHYRMGIVFLIGKDIQREIEWCGWSVCVPSVVLCYMQIKNSCFVIIL